MIPQFRNSGDLPIGVHVATLEEFKSRFCNNIKRRQLFDGLLLLIDDLRSIGCKVIYIDGSYTTNKRLPKDIDVCWEIGNLDVNQIELKLPILFDLDPPRNMQKDKYNCDVFPSIFEATQDRIYLDFFQINKETQALKGIIQINL